MAKRYLTYCLFIAGILSMQALQAQTVHPYGLEQMISVEDDDLIGTPRFIAMSGAMTAVGGDPSAVKLNPAGLGIYRHSQFSVSGSGTFKRFMQLEGTSDNTLYSRWHLSQLSYVFALTHPQRLSGVVSNNIMISYVRRADMLCYVKLGDRNESATLSDWLETGLDEYANKHDIDLHYAMNISNRVYWGLGFTIEWGQMRQTVNRWEYTSSDRRGQRRYYELSETFNGRGVGCGGSFGILAHPVRALRIGASIQSPVVGRMRETDYYTEVISYSGRANDSKYESPDDNFSWRMVTPLKASAGLGLQWKNHGLLSLQYDLQYHKLAGVSHTARAGLEAALSNHWMFEAGYAYATLFSRQRASAGFNYMGRWLRVGVAYSFSWSAQKVIDSIYYTEQGVFQTREHKLVLSFQWNT